MHHHHGVFLPCLEALGFDDIAVESAIRLQELCLRQSRCLPCLCHCGVVLHHLLLGCHSGLGIEGVEGVAQGCVERLVAVYHLSEVGRETETVHAVVRGERSGSAFFQVHRHGLSGEGCGCLLVVEHGVLLVVAVDSGQVNAVGCELSEHFPLRGIEIGAAPTVALGKHNEAVVGEPLPLVK